jgi:uncharacterized coiled-coil DUF342 family protein
MSSLVRHLISEIDKLRAENDELRARIAELTEVLNASLPRHRHDVG